MVNKFKRINMAKGRFYGNPTIQNSSPDNNTSPNAGKKLNPLELYQKISDPKRKQTPMDLWSKAAVANTFENTSVGNSKYDEGLNWNTDVDTEDIEGSINEHRSNEQSGLTQLGAGLLRAGTKAAIEVAKLPGVISGIAAAPFAEEGKGYDVAFNNAWIKGLDKVNEEINSEFLPVYAKKAVTEGNLWDNITSTSFWATDGADGLGFMLGMMAPGAIISKLGMGAKLLNGSRKLAQYAGMAEKTESAVSVLKGLGLTARSIDVGTGAVVNTITEAGAEAKGVGDDMDGKKPQYFSENFPKNIAKLNVNNVPEMIQGSMRLVKNLDGTQSMVSEGLIPNPEFEVIKKQASELTEAEFKEQRALAMRDTFKSNLAVLIVPNLLMSKALFGKKADKLVSNLEKTTLQKAATRGGKIVKRYGKAFASEGLLEEGSQTAIETMFTDKAMQNELKRGDGFDGGFVSGGLQDFNLGEATEAYSDMINSTEGEKAIFLGAIMGAPMMSYQGRKEDVYNQEKSNKILSNIDSSINSFNTIFNNDIYRRDPNDSSKFLYKKDENGNDTTERQIDRVKAIEVAKSLNYNEQQSRRLDWAIQNGRTEIIEELREKAIFDLIQPSIYYGEAGIEALTEKLKNSSQFQEVLDRDSDPQNKNKSKDFVDNALKVASYLQKQNEKFVDFAGDIIDLNDDRASKEDKQNYINHLNTQYLQAKYNQYNSELKLKHAVEKRNSILEELNIQIPVNEILENNRQVNEARQNNKILDDNLNEIKLLEESITSNKKNINELWSGKDKIDKSFKGYIDRVKGAEESQSDEKIAKANETVSKIKKAKNKKELNEALEVSSAELSKAVQSQTIDEVNDSVDQDSSIDNLQLNLTKLKSLGLSSKKVNKVINKIESILQSKIQEIEDFKIFLEEAIADHNIKSEKILSDIIDTENNIKKLISDRELLKKSLNNQDKSPRGRNAKILKELIRETKDELDRVEKEIESLTKDKNNLTNDLEVADKEIEYILTKYNQSNKEQFKSIKDIINYLENNKKYFTSEHRHGLEKLLINQFITGKEIDFINESISSLENYVEVLNQTIRNLLDSEENHSEDLYYLQEQLNDSKENLVKYKETLKELTSKINRIDDAINSKEGLNSLNKEIEFWEKFQEFKKENVNDLYDNPVIQQIIDEKEIELTEKELKEKKKEEKRQRELDKQASLSNKNVKEVIEPEIIINEDGEFESESIPEELDSEVVSSLSANDINDTKSNIEKEESLIKSGTKLISTNQKTGEAFSEVYQQFVDYEKEPRDKSKDVFTFDLGGINFASEKVKKSYNKLINKEKLDKQDVINLEEGLPIKVIVNYTTKDENGDDVNRSAFSFIEYKSKAISENENSLKIYKEQNEPLRKSLINYLIDNKSFEGVSTNLHSQFPGILKIDSLEDGVKVKKNNIFDLDVFKDMSEEEKIEYFQKNTAYVNTYGELLSTLGNKKRIKMMSPDNRGKVFLKIPMSNGSDFWLKLNINRITEDKSEAVYEMIKAISAVSETIGAKGLNAISIDQFFNSLDESDPILSNRLQTVLEDEIKLVEVFDKGKVANRNLARLLDLIVYHKSKNKKTAFNLNNDGSLLLGSLAVQLMDGSGFKDQLSINKEELQSDVAKDVIMSYLSAKRYNVLITKDSPGQFVFNNKEYVKYLLGVENGNKILSTNAVVNESTFGGYSNIYINQNLNSNKPTEVKKEIVKKPVKKAVVNKINIKTSNIEVVSDASYKAFKDNERVSDIILDEISRKIYNKEALSERENEIYAANNKHINEGVQELGTKPVDIISSEGGGVIKTMKRFADAFSTDNTKKIVDAYEKANEDAKTEIIMNLSDFLEESINMEDSEDKIFKDLIKIAKSKKISIENSEKICSL